MRLRNPTPISLLRAGPPTRRDLVSDTRTRSFSIEQHFVLQPILYAIITLSVHFPRSLLFFHNPLRSVARTHSLDVVYPNQ